MATLANPPAGRTTMASRAPTINRTADIMMTITASNRVTKMNTTTTSITTRVALRKATHKTAKVSLGAASTTLRRILRPSATSQ